jgi:hypothetical protein
MSTWSPTPPQGNLCTGDGKDGGCATDEEQCGYSLFELRDQPDTGVLRELDYIITETAGRNRGSCMRDLDRTCGVAGSDGCGTDNGPCIAYRFEAGAVEP